MIESIISDLKTRIPQLSLIPDTLLDSNPDQFVIILSKKHRFITTKIRVYRANLEKIFFIFKKTLPSTLTNILAHVDEMILLNIDSIINGPLEVFVFSDTTQWAWFKDSYHTDLDVDNLTRIEFLIDSTKDTLINYKYYSWNVETRTETEHCYNPDGNPDSTSGDITRQLYTEDILKEFNIDGLKIDGYTIKYVVFSDKQKSYLSITKNFSPYKVDLGIESGAGGSNPE
jgi:hypothetical protein